MGCYIVMAFCGCFRGAEVFLFDLFGLKKYASNDNGYVIIPLLGRFKNELGLDYHLTPLAGETNFVIKVKLWVKVISMYERERRGIMDKLF